MLVTPARNEARFIEGTIQSVIAQTARPLRWAIVSDGSTDGTDEIVSRYAAQHGWIELVRMPERKERHFAGKVFAFNAGMERMKGLPYAGSRQPGRGYYIRERLLRVPACETGRGSSAWRRGHAVQRHHGRYATTTAIVSTDHVSGACQVFRRICFEQIGGYVPSRGGCIDTIATLTARSRGWKTRSFTEKISLHHRVIGTAEQGQIRSRFVLGKRDWAIGNHPLWEACRGLYQMTKKPYLLRGFAILAGYAASALRGGERPVSRELRAFRRKEEMAQLARFFHLGARQSDASGAPRGTEPAG